MPLCHSTLQRGNRGHFALLTQELQVHPASLFDVRSEHFWSQVRLLLSHPPNTGCDFVPGPHSSRGGEVVLETSLPFLALGLVC